MHKNFKLLAAAASIISLSGCALVERRTGPAPVPEVSGEKSPPYEEQEKAPPVPNSPKRVGIILGPGGAKALAHAGVLKELNRARIPITHVVGLEWGSLVGALFAQKGQVHEMEWKLYKMEKQPLPSKSFFSSQLQAGKVSELRPYLKDCFGSVAQPGLDVRFSCPAQVVKTGELKWQEAGSFANSVEACLGLPPLYSAKPTALVAAVAVDEAIDRLRSAGAEVVVLVNVLGGGELFDMRQLPDSGASAILWNDIRRHLLRAKPRVDYWLEVSTDAISISDFERRREAVTAGEKAGQLAAKQMMERYGF